MILCTNQKSMVPHPPENLPAACLTENYYMRTQREKNQTIVTHSEAFQYCQAIHLSHESINRSCQVCGEDPSTQHSVCNTA